MFVPWVSSEVPSLCKHDLRSSTQKVFLNPLGDPSDPAVTKAIFLVTVPEPKAYLEKGSSALALLSSLLLRQKLSGHSASHGRNLPVPNSGL